MENRQPPSSPSNRVALLDELRGLFILLMVFYHGCYDLAMLFPSGGFPLFFSKPMQFLQLLIAGDFIMISGAACRYSRNNRRRGIQVLACGMLLTAVTAVVMPSQLVAFGILHFLGTAMLLFSFAHKLLDRLHPTWGILLSAFLLLACYFIPQGLIGFPPLTAALPSSLYATPYLFWLGFPDAGFYSSDYFPILPWIFLFLAGSYIGVYLRSGHLPLWVYRPHIPWLAKVGRYTIWIYMFHQPILYAVMSFFFALLNL